MHAGNECCCAINGLPAPGLIGQPNQNLEKMVTLRLETDSLLFGGVLALARFPRLPSNRSPPEEHPMMNVTMRNIARREAFRKHRTAKSASRRASPRIEALEARIVLSTSTPYLQT